MLKKLLVLSVLVITLSLSILQSSPSYAQDGGETPAAVREAAITALNNALPNIGRPTAWRHTILGSLDNTALGCVTASGTSLDQPVTVYQIWLTYGDTEYLYHVSEDGTLVQACDPKLPATESQSTALTSCPADFAGYMRPHLILNGEGRVRVGDMANHVRIQPSLSGEIAFQMDPGTSFAVISGPQCNEGIVWWMVQTDTGSGWTAESNTNDNGAYYLEPTGKLSDIPLSTENITDAVRINAPFEFVLNLTIDQSGQLLLNTGTTLERYQWNTLAENSTPEIMMPQAPTYIGASSNGQYIVTGSHIEGGYRIHFWNSLDDGNLNPDQAYQIPNDRGLMDLAVNNDGIVAMAHGYFGFGDSQAGPVMLWNGNTNTEMVLLQHNALVTDIAFNHTGTLLATSTINGGTFIWSVPDGTLVTTLAVGGIPVFSPDDATLAIGGRNGNVSLWATTDFMNVGNIRAFEPFDIWPSAITAINYSPDGSLLAIGRGLRFVDGGPPEGFTADVKVIDIAEQSIAASFVGDANYVNDVAFAPDGTALIVNEIGNLYYLVVQP